MKQSTVRSNEVRVPICDEWDVPVLRQIAREVGKESGLKGSAIEALATALSEIANNIVIHAGNGEVCVNRIQEGGRRGVVVVASDNGPGIQNPLHALTDGYSTVNGLGLGLSSASRLVDEFRLESVVGKGTTVILKKWAS
jgi:serine/threonine-protein kinase RsbT